MRLIQKPSLAYARHSLEELAGTVRRAAGLYGASSVNQLTAHCSAALDLEEPGMLPDVIHHLQRTTDLAGPTGGESVGRAPSRLLILDSAIPRIFLGTGRDDLPGLTRVVETSDVEAGHEMELASWLSPGEEPLTRKWLEKTREALEPLAATTDFAGEDRALQLYSSHQSGWARLASPAVSEPGWRLTRRYLGFGYSYGWALCEQRRVIKSAPVGERLALRLQYALHLGGQPFITIPYQSTEKGLQILLPFVPHAEFSVLCLLVKDLPRYQQPSTVHPAFANYFLQYLRDRLSVSFERTTFA